MPHALDRLLPTPSPPVYLQPCHLHPPTNTPGLSTTVTLPFSNPQPQTNTHTTAKMRSKFKDEHPVRRRPQPLTVAALLTTPSSRSARRKLSASDRSTLTAFRYVPRYSGSHQQLGNGAPVDYSNANTANRSSARRLRSRTSQPSTRRSTWCQQILPSASSST